MAGRPRKIQPEPELKGIFNEVNKSPIITNKLLNFADFRHISDTFIESGSCKGDGIQRAIDSEFKEIKSVEVMDTFYTHCVNRFKSHQHISIFHGKSIEHLEKMIVLNDKPLVIFLDSHPAGPNTGGHDDLMNNGIKSEFHQHNIITKELELILAHRNDHCIIIDDINGMNPECEQYIQTLYNANPSYKFYFYDEHLPGGTFYKNKCLVAIPE